MGILKLITISMERSYSLTGPESQHAIEAGLANAECYRTPVDRKRMKELMKRSDMPALRDTAIWLGLLIATGAAGIALWGTWWAVPVFIVYGVLYATASDSRWHGLCCTKRLRDSSRESSVVAVMHEQTDTPDLQDQELASL